MSTSEIVVEVWLEVVSPLTCAAEPADHTKLEATLAVSAKPTASPLQIVSDEAELITGVALFVRTTSSETIHGPSVTVQRSVAEVPAGTPVTAVVGEDGVAIETDPATTVQSPLPEDGALPANVKAPLPHCV